MFTRENLSQLKNTAQLLTMDWSNFEWFSKYFFEHFGFEKTHVTGKHGEFDGDGGIDVEMYDGEGKIYVQCKRWTVGFNGTILPLHVVRELGGCMYRDRVKKGVVMTTLDIDESCKREAKLMNIELYGLAEIAANMKLINPEFGIEVVPTEIKKRKVSLWGRFLLVVAWIYRFFFRD